MKKKNAPGILRPWVATFAKWASIGMAVVGLGYGLTHGMSNIIGMFEWASPTTSAFSLGAGVVTHLMVPVLAIGSGLFGYHVARNTEILTREASEERQSHIRDQKAGKDVPRVSVMMEREGKVGNFATTVGSLLGFSAVVGGGMALTHWVIGGMAVTAAPAMGALLIAAGGALAATSIFARNASDYANSKDTEVERRQILAEAQVREIARMQEKVGEISNHLNTAMAEAKFHNRQYRDSWASKIRAERLREASQHLDQADKGIRR